MRSGYSTAVVLVSLALVCLLGWAASHASTPAVVSATVSPAPAPSPLPATPVPSCRADQLGLGYLAGQPIGGHDFGIIEIWDSSAEPCSLTSPITVAGLGSNWRAVTAVQSYVVAAPQALTANGTSPGEGLRLRPGERVAPLIVAAEFRFDPVSHRICARPVEPAAWRLKFASGGVLTVRDADLRARGHTHGLPADHGLLTCRGILDAPAPVMIAPR